jgi:hypothetical protein
MILLRTKTLRLLDFDIENRPLSYWADRPSAEVTAIAWSWVGERKIHSALLGEMELPELLESFRVFYDQADMVTGHYIRKHDLPHLNGALMELQLPKLGAKLASDTKCDLIRRGDLPASQEALAGYLGLTAPKVHMTQADWREANRLTPEGLRRTRQRVEGDVRQHKELRERMVELGWLRLPKVWSP